MAGKKCKSTRSTDELSEMYPRKEKKSIDAKALGLGFSADSNVSVTVPSIRSLSKRPNTKTFESSSNGDQSDIDSPSHSKAAVNALPLSSASIRKIKDTPIIIYDSKDIMQKVNSIKSNKCTPIKISSSDDSSPIEFESPTSPRTTKGTNKSEGNKVEHDLQLKHDKSLLEGKFTADEESEPMPFIIHPSIRFSKKQALFNSQLSSDSSSDLPRKSQKQTRSSKVSKPTKSKNIKLTSTLPLPTQIYESSSDGPILLPRRTPTSQKAPIILSDSGSATSQKQGSNIQDASSSDDIIPHRLSQKQTPKTHKRSSKSQRLELNSDDAVSSDESAPAKKRNLRSSKKQNHKRSTKFQMLESNSDDFIASDESIPAKRSKSKSSKKPTPKRKEYSSSDLLQTQESEASCDMSFYRNFNNEIEMPIDLEEAAKESREKLNKFRMDMDGRRNDRYYANLKDYLQEKIMKSDEFYKLKRFFTKILEYQRPELYDDLDSDEEHTAREVEVYLEKEFLDELFTLANNSDGAFENENAKARAYDSLRIEEFLTEIPALYSNDQVVPNFMRAFIDKVENALSRNFGTGQARKGTPVDVEIEVQKRVVNYVLFERIRVSSLPSKTVEKSRLLFLTYTEYRDEEAKARPKVYSGKSVTPVTEKDRGRALNRMIKDGDDVSLILCQVCQSFPRQVTHQVLLQDMSEVIKEEEQSQTSGSDSDVPMNESKTSKTNDQSIFDYEESDSDVPITRPKQKQDNESGSDSEDSQASNDSSEVNILQCTKKCAFLLYQIAQVSRIWRLCHKSPTLSQIPDLIHRFNRQQNKFTELELIKLLIHTLYTSAEENVRFTNSCRHYQMANSGKYY